ncbi:MAG: hypothetical protein ABI183_15005, partial [Polyangiaceae bacterium]
MAKDVIQFVCQACAAVTPKWVGRCGQCGAWNTIVEEISRKKSGGKVGSSLPVAKPQLVSEIDADHAARVPTGIADTLVGEFDLVDLLTLVADRSVDVLDVAAAGLMVAGPDGALRVVASSSDAMRVLELFEVQAE